MNKYRARLKDISTLEFAESKAKSRLTFIRRSMVSKTDGTEQMASCDPTLPTHIYTEFDLSYPSNPFLSYTLCSRIQKPVVIAVRFVSITRSAAAVRTHSVCLTLAIL